MNSRTFRTTLAALLLASGSALLAQKAPPGGKPLLDPEAVLKAEPVEEAPPGFLRSETPAKGPGFSKAMRLTLQERPGQGQMARVRVPVPAGIADGDVLLAVFSLRTAEGRQPRSEQWVEVNFRPGVSRFSDPLRMPTAVKAGWNTVMYPFSVRRDYKAGEAELTFTLREAPQSVELAGVQLINYGKKRSIPDLPVTTLSYAGAEPDAPWRTAAQERIEKIRKGDLTVAVKDASGRPVPGAAVSVNMTRHAFGFGSAVSVPTLVSARGNVTPEDVRMYRQMIPKLFNKAVFDNALKWPQWEDTARRDDLWESLRWLRESGLEVRGHVLVWPSWRWTPVKRAMDAKDNPPALARIIIDHITEVVSATKGQIVEWDVINEPFSNHDFMDILGNEAMVEWFRAARRADPDVKLYMNDYAILSGEDKKHQDHYFETLKFLLEKGAPVDGIGMQGHFPPRATAPEEMLRRLDRFAAFGKPIQITEFDFETADEQTQAAFTRDFMTVVFSHPSVNGFLMWGFWEKSHWKPICAMYRRDWTAKPNAKAYEELVFKEWWTKATGTTKADGSYQARGFLGDYEIVVRSGSQVKTVQASISKEGGRVEVRLDGGARASN